MTRAQFLRTVHYFELASWLVALVIGLGLMVATARGGSTWRLSEAILLAGFGVVFAVVCMSRPRAFAQRMPWLATAFCISAAIAMFIVFSRWDTVWFFLAMSFGCAVLAIGSVARTKTIDQPFSRADVFKLLTLAGSVLFGLVALEVLVRLGSGLFAPETQALIRLNPGDYGVSHPYIGHLHTPGSSFAVSGKDFHAVHHVDDVGFRNERPWQGTQADIVVVGDSVAFGYGVADEKAWPALLARSLPKLRLVNLALIGAGPQQYLRVFEAFGVELRPKLLLVGVWAMNDFTDAAGFEAWQQSGVGGNDLVWRDFGKPQRIRFSLRHPISWLEGLFRADVYPLLRRSYLYNLIWALRGGWGVSPGRSTITMPFPDGTRLQLEFPREAATAARSGSREFQLLLDTFVRLHEMANNQGAHALMVLQPGKEEVYLPLVGQRPLDLTADLRGAFNQRRIEYLDLGPGFREAAKAGMRLYHEVDGHPNEAGYQLMAQLVLAHLEQHKAKYGLSTADP